MADKIYEINLSLGFKTIQINFEEDKPPVQIRFNPADDDLAKRLFECEDIVKGKLNELEEKKNNLKNDAEKNGEDTYDRSEYVKLKEEINKNIKDMIDYAFGNKISDEVFKYCSPTAIVKGKRYILAFLEEIAPVMQEIITAEVKKSNAYDNKYYSKYIKNFKK